MSWVRRLLSPSTGGIVGLAAGFLAGTFAHGSDAFGWSALEIVCRILGGLWLAGLSLAVIPLVLVQVALAALAFDRSSGRRGAALLAVWGGQLLLGLAIALLVAPPVISWLPPPRAILPDAVPFLAGATAPAERAGAWLARLLAAQPLEAVCEKLVFPALLAALLLGLALRLAPDGIRQRATSTFAAGSRRILVVVGVLLRFLAAGSFALAFLTTARSGIAWVGAIGYYVVLCSALLALTTLLLYPLTALCARLPVRRFAAAVWPSQLVAAGTRSSLATVPAMIEGAEVRLGLAPEVAGFVLPLSAATFKINRGVLTPTKMLVMAAAFGIHPSARELLVFLAMVVALSLATPGIPAGTTTALPAYLAVGIPLGGILLFAPPETLMDPLETVANVTGSLSAAAVVARSAGQPATQREPVGGAAVVGGSTPAGP